MRLHLSTILLTLLFPCALATVPSTAGSTTEAAPPPDLLTAKHGLPDTQTLLKANPMTAGVGKKDDKNNISSVLFAELEELARIVDIAYCVGSTGLGIQKPFSCLGRCNEFPHFELIKTWNTGPLLSDSCGYIALSHSPAQPRIIVAFRGTYSITNTIADLSTVPQEYIPYPGSNDTDAEQPSSDSTLPKCENCTVHMGFYRSWRHTRDAIVPALEEVQARYPNHTLTLVGHSLGGAVALLAALNFVARGWDPRVTTFGEPRAGNKAFMEYVDAVFGLDVAQREDWRYHRLTHVGDPVPLLPLEEWGYRMHAGELFITRPDLPPSPEDIIYCEGREDPRCIMNNADKEEGAAGRKDGGLEKMGLWDSWDRLKLWQLFFAHRDYFWRLGLCVPGGDPWDWGRERPAPPKDGVVHEKAELR